MVSLILTAMIVLGQSPVPAGSAEDAVAEATSDGQTALRRSSYPWYPWYSWREDEYYPITPPRPATNTGSSFKPSGNSGAPKLSITGLGDVAKIVIYVLLAIVIGLLIYMVLSSLRSKRNTGDKEEEEDAHQAARIEALPIKAPKKGDFLDEAMRHVERGDLASAIIYYYSHQLLALDKGGVIRLAKGKTNRRYIGEVSQSLPTLRPHVSESALLFEEAFFGKLPISEAAFFRVWNWREDFRRTIESAEKAGATSATTGGA